MAGTSRFQSGRFFRAYVLGMLFAFLASAACAAVIVLVYEFFRSDPIPPGVSPNLREVVSLWVGIVTGVVESLALLVGMPLVWVASFAASAKSRRFRIWLLAAMAALVQFLPPIAIAIFPRPLFIEDQTPFEAFMVPAVRFGLAFAAAAISFGVSFWRLGGMGEIEKRKS